MEYQPLSDMTNNHQLSYLLNYLFLRRRIFGVTTNLDINLLH